MSAFSRIALTDHKNNPQKSCQEGQKVAGQCHWFGAEKSSTMTTANMKRAGMCSSDSYRSSLPA